MEKSIKQVKEELAENRVIEHEIKAQVDKLGERTVSVTPIDLEIMYAGKMADMLMQQKVRSINTLKAYRRDYEVQYLILEDKLLEQHAELENDFKNSKKRLMKIMDTHPLWERLSPIKGFSSYMMGLLMSYVKDIGRFNTASALCVYSGTSSINGIAITKAKISEIKLEYIKSGKEFHGFNTKMSGRLHVLAESLMKQKGFFYEYYLRTKERLIHRAMANDETELREDKVPIMKGKKNQPLRAWAHANASRRMIRIFLHIFWKEWREVNGLTIRAPYAEEYLGHSSIITLEEIVKAGG